MEESLHSLRAHSKELEPIMRIGKSGITDSVLKEIEKHLKKRKLIKVKILKNIANKTEKEEIKTAIIEKTGASIVSYVGNSCVLYKQ